MQIAQRVLIQTQLVQDRGVNVAEVDWLLDGRQTDLVGGAVGQQTCSAAGNVTGLTPSSSGTVDFNPRCVDNWSIWNVAWKPSRPPSVCLSAINDKQHPTEHLR